MSKTLEQIQRESAQARLQQQLKPILQPTTTQQVHTPMTEFAKWWTIFNIVWQIVANFTAAGGPSVNPLIVANETGKELVRKVASGFLPADILTGYPDIIQAAIDAHPAIQNISKT